MPYALVGGGLGGVVEQQVARTHITAVGADIAIGVVADIIPVRQSFENFLGGFKLELRTVGSGCPTHDVVAALGVQGVAVGSCKVLLRNAAIAGRIDINIIYRL